MNTILAVSTHQKTSSAVTPKDYDNIDGISHFLNEFKITHSVIYARNLRKLRSQAKVLNFASFQSSCCRKMQSSFLGNQHTCSDTRNEYNRLIWKSRKFCNANDNTIYIEDSLGILISATPRRLRRRVCKLCECLFLFINVYEEAACPTFRVLRRVWVGGKTSESVTLRCGENVLDGFNAPPEWHASILLESSRFSLDRRGLPKIETICFILVLVSSFL